MRVILDDSVLKPDAVDPLALLAVIQQCRESDRHSLFGNEKLVENWSQVFPKILGAQIRKVLKDGSAQRRSETVPAIRIIANCSMWRARDKKTGKNSPMLHPREALRLLQAPLRVLVENARNDGAFLLRMSLGRQRQRLQHALEMGWLIFEHAGGIRELTRILQKCCDLDDTKPDSWIRWLRLWVMFDRDAHVNDCTLPSVHTDEALDTLAALQRKVDTAWLGGKRLERRTIENYLPKEGLLNYATQATNRHVQQRRKATFDAFYHPLMNDPTGADRLRANYPMSEGLNKHERIALNIYSNLDNERWEGLAGGFGDEVKKLWADERPGLRDEWIEREGNSPKCREIERLISDILERI